MTTTTDVQFGRGTCCWKPQGCTVTRGCRLMRHPAKRAMLGDRMGPCPKGWVVGDRPVTCGLPMDHEGDCEARNA
jgi:hypothetical protein